MKTIYLTLIPALVLPLLAGCGTTGYLEGADALDVYIRDARTGVSVARHATVVARSGNQVDTARGPHDAAPNYNVVALAVGDRPGTYEVTVTHPEYQTWHREGIRVPVSRYDGFFDNTPLPKTTKVVAELQPRDGSQAP